VKSAAGKPLSIGLFSMWGDTRLVVLTAVIAAIHASAVIPFKVFPFLPGVTDLRPAMALPVVFSILFGPAAAWGAAIGTAISDLFGSLGPGSAFGFLGNLLYGWLPWRIWHIWHQGQPRFRTASEWAAYSLCAVAASGACALTIGWGIHVLRLYHFASTTGLILANNVIMSFVLAPPLLLAVGPRVARMGLTLSAPPGRMHSGGVAKALSATVALIALGGILAGYSVWLAAAPDSTVTLAVAPFLAALVLAIALL